MSLSFKVLNYYKNQRVPSLFLFIDQKSYLINLPSLIQRYLSLKSVNITDRTDIIITSTNLDYHNGLKGFMCQTTARNLNKSTNIIMPYELQNYIQNFDYVFGKTFANFSFCGLKDHEKIQSKFGLPIQSKECQNMSLFNFCNWDGYIQQLQKEQSKKIFNIQSSIKKSSIFLDQKLMDDYQLMVLDDKQCEIIFIPMDKNKTKFSLLFIPKIKKNLDKQKLSLYKLKGKQVGQLQKDKQIKIDGQIYSIEFFYKKIEKSSGLLLFDLNNDQDKQNQNQNLKLLEKLFMKETFEIDNVIHLYNHEIFENSLYQNYCQFFNNTNRCNIFINQVFEQDFNPYNGPNFYLNYTSYHLPYIFPEISQEIKSQESLLQKNYKNYQLINGRNYYLLKKKEFNKLNHQNKTFLQKKQDFDKIFDFQNNAELKKYNSILQQKNDFKNFPFIIFLGTGSQNPNPYRNVSSILLGINDQCYILLDCGEGTYIQLLNQFGDQIQSILKKIKYIHLSHIHGDHTFGTFSIIRERQKVLDKENINDPLIVCGPSNTRKMFKTFEDYIGYKSAYYFITLEKLMQFQKINIKEFNKYFTSISSIYEAQKYWNYRYIGQREEIEQYNLQYINDNIKQYLLDFLSKNKIKKILPIPVIHCAQSSGVRLDLETKSIVYSGDCQRSKFLSQYGKDCDLMIHECTLDCQFSEQQVKDKGHSDPSIALDIANNSKSKYLALTHLSQRYQYSKIDQKCQIQIFRQDKQYKEYFLNNTFMARDHLYMDFEILPILCKIHNNFNKFEFTDLE